ncbi:MAG: arginine--tRNA ligase, partial [Deltaproteobacteria bacterium]|nr:arginine--tRNA ligase [Deltaproteobacteria bacterium]
AHARICSVFRQAGERGVALSPAMDVEAARLELPEELRLLKLLGRYPEVVSGAAAALEPHRLTYYLHELCDEFHRYYNRHRILTEDPGLTAARLALICCVRTVLAGALGLLGVSAPETM